MRIVGITDMFKRSRNKGEVKKEAWGKNMQIHIYFVHKDNSKDNFLRTQHYELFFWKNISFHVI